MGEAQDLLDDLRGPARSLRDAAPEAWKGFAELHRASLADGALPGYVKELMALVIAVSKECDGCIASHARGAARKGATPEQVAEAISVAILMNGGPATVYGPRAWAAFNEFAQPRSVPTDGGVGS